MRVMLLLLGIYNVGKKYDYYRNKSVTGNIEIMVIHKTYPQRDMTGSMKGF